MARPGEDIPLRDARETSELLGLFLDDGFVLQPNVLDPGALAEVTAASRASTRAGEGSVGAERSARGQRAASRSFDLNDFESPQAFLRQGHC